MPVSPVVYCVRHQLFSDFCFIENISELFSISIDAATYAMVGFVTGILLTKYLLWYDDRVK